MAIDRSEAGEQQARVDAMVEEFKQARQRRLVKQGVILWNRAETALRNAAAALHVDPAKKN